MQGNFQEALYALYTVKPCILFEHMPYIYINTCITLWTDPNKLENHIYRKHACHGPAGRKDWISLPSHFFEVGGGGSGGVMGGCGVVGWGGASREATTCVYIYIYTLYICVCAYTGVCIYIYRCFLFFGLWTQKLQLLTSNSDSTCNFSVEPGSQV